jgi:hypothetical protein
MRTHSNQPCAETLGGSGQECAPCTIRGVEASVDGVRESRPKLGLAPRSSHHGHKARVRREACRVDSADRGAIGSCIASYRTASWDENASTGHKAHTCWLLVWHKLAPQPAVFNHSVGVPMACIRPRRSRSLRTFFAPNLRNGTRWERERSQPDQRSHEFVLRESAAPSVMPQITAKKALLGVHETPQRLVLIM